MQWDGTRNAGFSSAEKTWLPVHPNHVNVNVENESKDSKSLLNTIKTLIKFRNGNQAIKEGSFEFLEGLPAGVLGYARKTDGQKLLVLLNFDEKVKDVKLNFSEAVYRLTVRDEAKDGTAHLSGFGGLILSS